jgi:hypothetical protein
VPGGISGCWRLWRDPAVRPRRTRSPEGEREVSRPGWLGRLLGGPRLTGQPSSANGASSFHLWWQVPAGPPIAEVGVTFRVETAPAVRALYFWALQVSFLGAAGRNLGGAHTGLQWHPAVPEGAVNWGGYDATGGELPGTDSTLPAVDSVNTRAWAWRPGEAYRIRVWSPGPARWRSQVTELATGRQAIIRDLMVDANALTSPVVWAEVFARCDDPPTVARWSDFTVIGDDGTTAAPSALRVTYQPSAAGGCDNTVAWTDAGEAVQATGQRTARPRRASDLLAL